MKIKNQKSKIKNSSAAFTLIEILVVIGIITLLMGLLLPVLRATRERGRIARADREVKEVRDAWEGYRLQYKRFPSGISLMDAEALAILRGTAPPNHHELNPRGIQYLDARERTEYYSDPWGSPDSDERAYRVALDDSGDNRVTATRDGQTYTLDVPVAVWSFGPRGEEYPDDDITSWEGGWEEVD